MLRLIGRYVSIRAIISAEPVRDENGDPVGPPLMCVRWFDGAVCREDIFDGSPSDFEAALVRGGGALS